MNALFFDGSLSWKKIPMPRAKNHEVLIKILYSAICNTDLEILKGYMGFTGVPGHEFVGEVVSKHSRFYGKNVVGGINCACGTCYLCQSGREMHCPARTVLGIQNHNGVFADFIVLPERNLHEVPESVMLETAVFTEPLAAALKIFEQIHLKPSENVFVFGAGKLGLLIAQVLRLNGCDFTVFTRSESKVSMSRSLGIHARPLSTLGVQEKAEVCIDCTGNPSGINLALSHLYPGGKLVLKTTVANVEKIDMNQVVINEFEIIGSRCGNFAPAVRLLSEGLVNPQPMITKIVSFENILEGFEYASRPDTLKVLIRH
jgi:threonine dehydrogenase-like Zn-dependent dehydrogenase